MKRKQRPVFFDASGKRWKKAKIGFAVIVSTLSIALVLLVPPIITNAPLPQLAGVATAAPSTGGLSYAAALEALNSHNTPVIGKGPLARAVSVRGEEIYDIFTGAFVRKLTPEDRINIDSSQYAIERYGSAGGKRIALTFDDGPDPAYTGKVLDLLSKEQAPSTFFMVGTNVTKYPELAKRVVREGHTLGNHTFTHVDFDYVSQSLGEQQINQTERIMRAVTGHSTAFMRVPYAGATNQGLRDSVAGNLLAQKMGYVISLYDYDTRDWQFKSVPKPDESIFDGDSKVVLLHDSGGNRQFTIDYLKEFIAAAKAHGYSFVSFNQLYTQTPALFGPVQPSIADQSAFITSEAVLVWPANAIFVLFGITVFLLIINAGINIILASLQRRRSRRVPHLTRNYRPLVSVIVPAYNEQDVLLPTVKSLFKSRYRKLEIIIVNDGSTDSTLAVARKLEAKYKRVRVLHQRNRGKAAALNHGIHKSNGEIMVCLDADTVLLPDTIRKLVRHFKNPRVGAVAGYVRVGNVRNPLTMWQALEYATSISIERNAQAYLGAVTVVPGACGAWRKEALLAAKGFSRHTLAEDCDLALAVHKAGYIITQDNAAISLTEAPLAFHDLAKQRFRWTFGNIQSYWKHRDMLFAKKYGWLGMVVLPSAAINILMPVLFWPLLITLTVQNIAAGRWYVIALFFGASIVLQFMVAVIGLRLARERLRYLVVVPMTRMMYGPLRTYLIFRSVLTVLRGVYVGWNKFARTQTITAQHNQSFQVARSGARK